MLSGSRADSYTGWLKQATMFYTNALKRENVITLGITQKDLEQGQALVMDVDRKFSHQHEQTAEAQEATKVRDLAFDELEEWVTDFIAISRIALEEKPQYMEMPGVVVKG